MIEKPIYLDYNATTPVDPEVVEAMLPYFTEKFGNAASMQHAFGWEAEEALDLSREQVAQLIRAKPSELVFTSGATEAINLALRGVFEKQGSVKNHIITCATEHKAVLDCCKVLEQAGATLTILGVDENGLIDLGELEKALTNDTLMVAVMHANNETGVLQPIGQIADLVHEHGALVFADLTQSAGKVPVDIESLKVDFAAFSSHKLYGPKGMGALYIDGNASLELAPQIVGGGHEKGLRSGTVNIPGVVGFGKACQLAKDCVDTEVERLNELRNKMEKDLAVLGGVKINGIKADRLPHVLNLSFSDVDGNRLLRALKGLAVSQGSACNSSVLEPSHVLKAMGLSDASALASLRISLGRFTTKEEIGIATKKIRGVIDQLRMQLL